MTDKKNDPATPEPAKTRSTSDVLSDTLKTPLHEQVFGTDPDGGPADTPRGAIGVNSVFGGTAVQPRGFGPMRSVGDTDDHH
jgi:hypothetical protein